MTVRRDDAVRELAPDDAAGPRIGPGEAAAVAASLLHGTPEQARARVAEFVHRSFVLAELVKLAESVSLDQLLPRLMDFITESLGADRATLFLHDQETRTLFSRVSRGDGITEIRIPAGAGIAGAVFTSGESAVIADAYADPRFNQEVDRRTGYRTRTILCVPLRNRAGR